MYAHITRFVFFISLITSSVAAFAVTPMVAEGDAFTVMLQADGTVMSWGRNDYGQLGDGTTIGHPLPKSVPGLTGVASVAGGYFHGVALKADGTVVAWGRNSVGQLGDGTTASHLSPAPVPGLSGVVAVAAGVYFTIALKADGTVVTWGNNIYGQLGDGTTMNRLSPMEVPGLTGVVAVAAGSEFAVVVKADGTVMAWGNNYAGQLGDGTTTKRLSPVAVPGLFGIVAIAAGGSYTVALKSDGTVMAWGNNYAGQLGDGTTTKRLSPVAVPGLSGIAAIAAGSSHTIALKTDGTVLTCGDNGLGQLGDGTTINRLSPTVVSGLTGVAAVEAGGSVSIATRSDGTVMAWGYNAYGQLGDGTIIDRNRPVGVVGYGAVGIPVLSNCAESRPYAPLVCTTYLSPNTGNPSTVLTYSIIYTHAANTAPSSISVCIDALPCSAMSLNTSAAAGLHDGNYANGEQYIYSTTLTTGTHSYYFTASDGIASTNRPATGSFSGPTISDLSITTSSLPDGMVGVAYSETLAAMGGTPPYSWSSGGLLPGVSLNGSTGEISGTPTTAGTYGFSVAVQDAVGTSTSKAFSIIVAVNPVITVPGAPTGLTCASGYSSAICSFTVPANDGGSAIIDYTATCIGNGFVPGGTHIATAAASPITVTGMINNTSYICTVVANNSVGSSSPSNNAYVIPGSPATVPGAPTIGTATAGDARATVSFTPPASNGGSAITSYTVSCSPACTPVSGPASPITVTGLTNGTTYTFTVTATNSVGTGPASAASNSVTPLATPSVPLGLTVISISAKQNNLSWMASYPSVSYYKIYRTANCLPGSVCILGFSVIATVPGTLPAPSYIDISSTDIFASSYGVEACNALGYCSGMSQFVAPAVYDISPPTVPTELTAAAVSASQINLAWAASTDNYMVSGYRVYRNGVLIASPTSVSFSDTGLASGSTNSYTVVACDWKGNCSAQSAAATATTHDNVAPTVPSGLSASAVSANQINLGWSASTDNVGVTGYVIYRDGVQVGTTTGTSYSDTGLTALTSYSYTVSACDAAGNCSAQSAAVTASTLEGEAPTVPGKLSARASSTTQIDLSWRVSTDNVGVTGYTVYRDGVQLGTTVGTSYSDTGLTIATSYQYTVAACDAAGNCSAQTSIVTGTTKRK